MLAKGDVIEEVHRHKGGPMITLSVCRKCHTAYLGREDVTVSQFRYMRDSKYDVRSHIRKMSSLMFVHKIVEAQRNLLTGRGLLD